MRRSKILAFICLVAAAILWGSTFAIVQDNLRTDIWFQLAARFLIASLMLAIFFGRSCWKIPKGKFKLYLLLGVSIATCFAPQTFGLQGTSVANASVITALFVVFTPLCSLFLMRQKPTQMQWLGSLVGFCAFLVLGYAEGFSSLSGYDGLIFITAFSVAVHTVYYGEAVKERQELPAALFWQFLIAAAIFFCIHLGQSPMLLPVLETKQWLVLAYLGIASTFAPYFLQALAQRSLSPVQVVLVISSEPFWAIAFANITRGDIIHGSSLLACGFLIFANLVSEIKKPLFRM